MTSVLGEVAIDSAGNDAVIRDFNERSRLLNRTGDENGRSPKKNPVEVRESESNLDSDSDSDSEEAAHGPFDDSLDPDEVHSRLNEEYHDLPWTRRPSALVLIVIFSLFAIGQSMVTASNLDVMFELICRTIYEVAPSHSPDLGTDPQCRNVEVAALVATFTSYRTTIVGALGVVVTPKLASYSDRFGRKSIILYCSCCALIADLVSFVCTKYPETIDYRFLLLASFMQGLGGSIMTVQVINSSYVADCIPPSLRAKSLAVLDSCLFGSFAVGPVIGSIILSRYQSLSRLYLISIGFYVTNILLLLFLLVESRPLKARRMSQVKYDADLEEIMNNSSNWQQYLHKVNFLKPLNLLKFDHLDRKSQRNARLLVLMASLGMEFAIAISPILMLLAELKFKWTGVEIGYMMSMFGVTRVIVLAAIFPIVLRILRSRYQIAGNGIDTIDLIMIRFGQVVSIFGYAALGNAPDPKSFLIIFMIDSLAGIQIPSMKNAIIKHAPQDRIGELLGGLSLINNFGMVVGPLIFFRIFNLTVATRPQMVFEIVSLGYLCLLITSFFLSKPTPKPRTPYGSTI